MLTYFSTQKLALTWSLIGLLLIGLTQASSAQTLTDTERDAIARDGAEKRRNQARESQLKEQQSKTPEVHLGNTVEIKTTLPTGETPMRPIRQCRTTAIWCSTRVAFPMTEMEIPLSSRNEARNAT